MATSFGALGGWRSSAESAAHCRSRQRCDWVARLPSEVKLLPFAAHGDTVGTDSAVNSSREEVSFHINLEKSTETRTQEINFC